MTRYQFILTVTDYSTEPALVCDGRSVSENGDTLFMLVLYFLRSSRISTKYLHEYGGTALSGVSLSLHHDE